MGAGQPQPRGFVVGLSNLTKMAPVLRKPRLDLQVASPRHPSGPTSGGSSPSTWACCAQRLGEPMDCANALLDRLTQAFPTFRPQVLVAGRRLAGTALRGPLVVATAVTLPTVPVDKSVGQLPSPPPSR